MSSQIVVTHFIKGDFLNLLKSLKFSNANFINMKSAYLYVRVSTDEQKRKDECWRFEPKENIEHVDLRSGGF